tara:strand:+ start:1148 stop:1492 length:345 start_codon:yes stop_codon:yes gene_type:complete
MDHFLNPRNVGSVDGPTGMAENEDCGDVATISLRVDGEQIVEARFQTTGCSGAIACCSAVTELLTGSALQVASELTAEDVIDYLDGLPTDKRGCAKMAAMAGLKAVRDALGAGD